MPHPIYGRTTFVPPLQGKVRTLHQDAQMAATHPANARQWTWIGLSGVRATRTQQSLGILYERHPPPARRS